MSPSIDELVLRPFDRGQVDALFDFFAALPEGDRTFVEEDVDDRSVVAGWAQADASRKRWLACDGTHVVGYLAVLPLPGWSSHVGELRLVVAPEARGRGVGRMLAERALQEALELGLSKIVVEVVAVQVGAVAMFNELGFRAEALLTDHIRDGRGELQDLVVLAHDVTAAATALDTIGAE